MATEVRSVLLLLMPMLFVVGCSREVVPNQAGTQDSVASNDVGGASANAQNDNAPLTSQPTEPLPETQPAPPLQFEPFAEPTPPAASRPPGLPPSSLPFDPNPASPFTPAQPAARSESRFDPSPVVPQTDQSFPRPAEQPAEPSLELPGRDPAMPKAKEPAPPAAIEPALQPDAAPKFEPSLPLDLTPQAEPAPRAAPEPAPAKAPEDAPAPGTNALPRTIAPPAAPESAARQWSDSSGLHELTASYAGYQNGWVRLAQQDGKTKVIQWPNLSPFDQGFVTARVEADKKNEPRMWTDLSGYHQVNGTFLEFKDGQVRLKKGDGGTVRVELSQLSNFDQGFVTAAGQ